MKSLIITVCYQVWDQVGNQFRDKVWTQIGSYEYWDIFNNVENQVANHTSHVQNQVIDQVEDQA